MEKTKEFADDDEDTTVYKDKKLKKKSESESTSKKSSSKQSSEGKSSGPDLKDVSALKKKLLKESTEGEILDALKQLKRIEMDLPTLRSTKIGKDVNVLKKHSSSDVASLAKILVGRWKNLLREDEK